VTLDYLEIVDPDTLEPVDRLVPGARALVAAEIGGVRLIDNLELVPR
jgi:pantoate--beta-alanine ligase